jgi:hypothetical protein
MQNNPNSFVSTNNDVTFIPIKHIKIDTEMKKILEKYNINISNYIIDKDDEWIGPLNDQRLLSVISAIKNKIPLPPIDVKIFSSPRKERQSYVPPRLRNKIKPKILPSRPTIYSVFNGRHRVVASIILKFTHIPAKIVV